MKRFILSGLFFYVGLVALRADSYFAVRVFGDPMEPGNAKSAAMGGAGVADYHPEGPRRILSLTAANVGTSQMWSESAAQTRLADESRFRLENVSLVLPFKKRKWEWRLFAAPVMDFNARSSYRIYNSTGLPAGENRFTGSGEILKLGSGISVPLGSKLSVKLNAYQLIGRETLRFGKYPLNGAPSLDVKETARYRGFSGEVGVRWRPSASLNVGAVYRPAVAVERSFQLADSPVGEGKSSGEQWQLPSQGILGFNFHPNDGKTVELAVDVKHVFWQQAAVNGKIPSGVAALKPIFREVISSTGTAAISSLRLRDVTEVGVGVNQRLGEKWSLQYGFHYAPFYADRRAETTRFSLGAGYRPDERWHWFLAGSIAKRDFIGDGIFYPAGWRVDEAVRRICLTVERSW